MSNYDPQHLLSLWSQEKVTAEMVLGHLIQLAISQKELNLQREREMFQFSKDLLVVVDALQVLQTDLVALAKKLNIDLPSQVKQRGEKRRRRAQGKSKEQDE